MKSVFEFRGLSWDLKCLLPPLQIRKVLVSKQMDEERLEKVRKLRELRKYGKKVQAEVQLRRQKEKKDMLDQVRSTHARSVFVLLVNTQIPDTGEEVQKRANRHNRLP